MQLVKCNFCYSRLAIVVTFVLITQIYLVFSDQKTLSRRKRYLSFPEGSSFSVAVCTTIGQIGNPELDYMSYALNWGISYNLPNESWVIQNAHGFKNTIIDPNKPAAQRRFRRELYEGIEAILDSMGYNGRDCIKRALCESRKFLSDRLGSMEVELVKKIFSLPSSHASTQEPQSAYGYDVAYRNGDNPGDCSVSYPKCGYSLIALAFGKHSRPFYNSM